MDGVWRGWRRWGVLIVAIAVFPLLGLFGLIGSGQRLRGQHVESTFVVVRPDGDRGVSVNEHTVIEFAAALREEFVHPIPNSSGVPTDIEMTSTARASFDLETVESGGGRDGETLLEVGTANDWYYGTETFDFSYTFPDARLDEGQLRLDFVGADQALSTDRFEVVVDGFEMTNPTCSIDNGGACVLARSDDGTYRAVIEHLDAGDRITIGGDDVVVGTPAATIDPADPPAPRPGWMVALILLAAELVAVGVAYAVASYRGANRVRRGDDTVRVADASFADQATVSAEPPADVRPWQGTVLVNEAIDHRSVGAWLAEMIAADAIIVDGGALTMADDLGHVDERDRQWVAFLFEQEPTFSAHHPPATAVAVWNRVAEHQQRDIDASGWWIEQPPRVRRTPERRGPNWAVISFVIVASLLVFAIFNPLVTRASYALGVAVSFVTAPLPLAIVIAAVTVGGVAWKALGRLLAVRSAAGSAVALAVLSFRNFLTGGDNPAAWDRTRRPEYAAWAVALDVADAWAHQLKAADDTDDDAVPVGALARTVHSFDSFGSDVALTEAYVKGSGRRRVNPWRRLGQMLDDGDGVPS